MKKQTGKIRAHSKSRRRKRRRQMAVRIAVCVLLILIIIYIMMYRYVNKVDSGTIHDNVYIGQIDVSGMTEKEAKAILQTKAEEYGLLKATLKVGEQCAESTLQELGLTMDRIDETVEEAVSYGKKGNVFSRWNQIRKLKKEKKVFEDYFQVGEEQMQAVIAEKAESLEVRAQNATIRHTEGGFEITDEVAGTMIDAEASIEKLNTYLNEEWNYTDIEFEMVQTVEEPKIKRADLETIQDVLGSYYTVAGSGNRVTNIRRAAELLNGTVLMPGETFSVEEATKPYTEENGYVSGGAYENGQVVQSIGGGLCQVSTTLYNAVLYAELEIVTRSAHSMMVNYVEPSRDAAIAEGLKDLQFKNQYDTPVLIEGYVDGAGNLRFYVYGKETRPENRTVEYESETLEKIEYTTKYVADESLSLGEMQSEGSKINGSVAKLWKVVYEDGQEVNRKVMNNSKYKASEVIVKVGTASDNAEAVSLVKNAVATQDEAKIKEAISQAQNLGNTQDESEEASE